MFDEAIGQYEELLERDPTHQKAIFNLSNLHIQMGNYFAALELQKLLLEHDPQNAALWNNIGSLHEELGDIERALHAWEQCLKLQPFQVEANINLARVQYRLWKSDCSRFSRRGIIDRINFALALDPLNDQAKALLKRVAGG
jgi:tetratricopeptide (TPR) repeat protein